MSEEPKVHNIQIARRTEGRGWLPEVVTTRAYEVYTNLYPGQSLAKLNERGGFGVGEVIAFLYAYPFPKAEWLRRTEEAFRGMKLDPHLP